MSCSNEKTTLLVKYYKNQDVIELFFNMTFLSFRLGIRNVTEVVFYCEGFFFV
jgi:hypothetical protein